MRICFVACEFVTQPDTAGGLATYLDRVTEALVAAGHEIHVIVRASITEDLQHNGVFVHHVEPKWHAARKFDQIERVLPAIFQLPHQNLKAAWSLWHRWAELKEKAAFDFVQIGNPMASGLFFRRERNVPVITRLSNHAPTWDKVFGYPINLGTRADWFLDRMAIRGTQSVYAPSRYVAQLVESDYGIENVDVIETPFFRQEFEPDHSIREQTIPAGSPYALFFGRFSQMKGTHVLAQALPEICEKLPDFRIALIGGDGVAPDGTSMKAYVASQVADYADRVHLIEALPPEQLHPFIEKAEFVVLPSLVDNLPNTVLESLGHGKLVLATTGSCFESVIDDDESGFLVAPNNPTALVEGLIKVWTLDPAVRHRMGAHATKTIERFHPNTVFKKLFRYYEQIAA